MNIKDILEVFDASVEFIQNTDVIIYSGFLGALLGGGKKQEDDDATFVECTDIVNETISDADLRGKIFAREGRDLRSQITVGEVLDATEEANVRRWPFGNRN